MQGGQRIGRLFGDRRREFEKGQSLVEFAVIVPVLLLIFMAIVGFGHSLMARMVVIQAANRAARLGAVLYGDSSISSDTAYTRTHQAAADILNSSLNGPDCTVSISESGDDLTVHVTYRSSVFVPLLKEWLGSEVLIEHAATYQIERDTT